MAIGSAIQDCGEKIPEGKFSKFPSLALGSVKRYIGKIVALICLQPRNQHGFVLQSVNIALVMPELRARSQRGTFSVHVRPPKMVYRRDCAGTLVMALMSRMCWSVVAQSVALPPPTNVAVDSSSITTDTQWIQGTVDIGWTAPPRPFNSSWFNVTVVPLTTPIIEPLLSNTSLPDWLLAPGKNSNQISAAGGLLRLVYDGGSWFNATAGINSAPRVLRRLPSPVTAASPPSAHAYLQADLDCSPAPAGTGGGCGIIVYNGANRMPLLLWGLHRSSGCVAEPDDSRKFKRRPAAQPCNHSPLLPPDAYVLCPPFATATSFAAADSPGKCG